MSAKSRGEIDTAEKAELDPFCISIIAHAYDKLFRDRCRRRELCTVSDQFDTVRRIGPGTKGTANRLRIKYEPLVPVFAHVATLTAMHSACPKRARTSGSGIANPRVPTRALQTATKSYPTKELETSMKQSDDVAPEWHFASTIDGDRFAVITDLDHDYAGWSVEVEQEGDIQIGQVVPKTLWRGDETDLNLFGLGDSVDGWVAPVEGGELLTAFFTPPGTRLAIDPWVYTREWLAESLVDQPVALIIDLGPNDYIPSEHDSDDVPCAQLQVMEDEVFLVRRSRTELGHLLLADYSTAAITLDKWYLQEHFDDCTDGYLFTKDRRLAAETCVTWFRDSQGPNEKIDIGCNYRFADQLVATDPKLF